MQVEVEGAGLRRAQQVEASQGLAGQQLGALVDVTRPLLQESGFGGERCSVAGRVKGGAALHYLWSVGGRNDNNIEQMRTVHHFLNLS